MRSYDYTQTLLLTLETFVLKLAAGLILGCEEELVLLEDHRLQILSIKSRRNFASVEGNEENQNETEQLVYEKKGRVPHIMYSNWLFFG